MRASNKANLRLSTQTGLSLMELMIAIPIGLLVMVGVAQVFRASLEGVYIQNTFSRVQENGRISTELLIRDIRGADYWGCVGDISAITNNLDTSDSDYNSDLLPSSGFGVEGANDVSSETEDGISVKGGTDMLTLRGSSSLAGAKIETPYMTTASSDITITASSSVSTGDVLLISDCTDANLFTNTSTSTASGLISHSSASLSTTGAINNSIASLDKAYDGSAQILIPYSKVYFIGQNSAGGYSLYRSLDGVAEELVRDVTDLQVTYGEDTGGNGSADSFVDASSVSDMGNVVSIRVQLTAESGSSSSGTQMLRDYEVTANIRNRSL